MNQSTEFLQSTYWRRFQEATGRETMRISENDHEGNGIVHTLPIVGRYLYMPRWPEHAVTDADIVTILEKAQEKRARWIRIEPKTEEILENVKKEVAAMQQTQGSSASIVVAPHNMQPRETFVVDITKNEEELLSAMKPKTRYNIRIAEKRGVKIFTTREPRYQQAFLDLITATAQRKDITPHPRSYYEKFFTALPEEVCFLFIAECDGRVLSANILVIYGTMATYLHGGSSNEYRDSMAPHLLQWEQMKFAKAHGCTHYDFGGVKTSNGEQITENRKAESQKFNAQSSWRGITRFKVGFSPQTAPTAFPGCYDIILDSPAYALYRRARHFQGIFGKIKKIIRH